MKKALALLLALVMLLAFAACGGGGTTSDATSADDGGVTSTEPESDSAATITKVGISMPTQSLQRWIQDGENLQKGFEAINLQVDLQYANDDVATQVSQIENMINGGCQVLVICAIDGSALTNALTPCKEKGIKVIGYDRLIMNSDALSYYASFDNFTVGKTQGQFIVDALKLETEAGPFNIEMFAGSPDDSNAPVFFDGAMEALKPFIDNGKLVVKSGQTEFAKCATDGWKTENAQTRMEDLISAQKYGPGKTELAAVLSNNDSIAQGLAVALLAAGYKGGENFPVITGQDCDIASTKNIIAGTQAMSVFKDTRILAERVVKMVESLAAGTEVEVNNTTDYDNGLGPVPSFLCDPTPCTIENYEKLLIEGGYYTKADLGIE